MNAISPLDRQTVYLTMTEQSVVALDTLEGAAFQILPGLACGFASSITVHLLCNVALTSVFLRMRSAGTFISTDIPLVGAVPASTSVLLKYTGPIGQSYTVRGTTAAPIGAHSMDAWTAARQ